MMITGLTVKARCNRAFHVTFNRAFSVKPGKFNRERSVTGFTDLFTGLMSQGLSINLNVNIDILRIFVTAIMTRQLPKPVFASSQLIFYCIIPTN